VAGQPSYRRNVTVTELPLNVAHAGNGSRADELRRVTMNDTGEAAATRLWRDRAQLREHERNEAQVRARITEEKVASLTAENDRLATENARLQALNDQLAAENVRLRALITPDPATVRAQTEREMEDLRGALLSLLAHHSDEQG
jgi:flagellar biosynthesis GTPase FlhF